MKKIMKKNKPLSTSFLHSLMTSHSNVPLSCQNADNIIQLNTMGFAYGKIPKVYKTFYCQICSASICCDLRKHFACIALFML